MAKYRTIKPTMWSNPWFEGLDESQKLLYIYMFTNEHVNNAGVMKVSCGKISFETKIPLRKVIDSLKHFEKNKKIERHGDLIWVVRFIGQQTSTSPKLMTNICKELDNITLSYPKLIANILDRYDNLLSSWIAYSSRNDTLSIHKEKEGEKEHEKEKEKEKETEVKERSARIRPKAVINLYHTHCPSLPKVVKIPMSANSTRMLNSRIKENPSEDFWKPFFITVESSDFLTGKCKSIFVADFHWLIRPTNMEKVINGRYDNREDYTNEVWEGAR